MILLQLCRFVLNIFDSKGEILDFRTSFASLVWFPPVLKLPASWYNTITNPSTLWVTYSAHTEQSSFFPDTITKPLSAIVGVQKKKKKKNQLPLTHGNYQANLAWWHKNTEQLVGHLMLSTFYFLHSLHPAAQLLLYSHMISELRASIAFSPPCVCMCECM